MLSKALPTILSTCIDNQPSDGGVSMTSSRRSAITRSPSAGSALSSGSAGSSGSDYSSTNTDMYTSNSTFAREDVQSVDKPIDTMDGLEINEVSDVSISGPTNPSSPSRPLLKCANILMFSAHTGIYLCRMQLPLPLSAIIFNFYFKAFS